MKYAELNSQALGVSLAAVGFICWLVGFGWHGMMGQPGVMGMMYGNTYMNPFYSVSTLVVFVIGGYLLGELIARIYNWQSKRR